MELSSHEYSYTRIRTADPEWTTTKVRCSQTAGRLSETEGYT